MHTDGPLAELQFPDARHHSLNRSPVARSITRHARSRPSGHYINAGPEPSAALAKDLSAPRSLKLDPTVSLCRPMMRMG